jgi:plastocyanin
MNPTLLVILERRRLFFSKLMSRPLASLCLGVVLAALCVVPGSSADGYTVTAEVKLVRSDNKQSLKDASKSVMWLVPADERFTLATNEDPHARMAQKDKRFHPDILVIPVGTYVDFPNLDPWFHNVFSLFRGKRFDLGLYQAGGQRSVRFDQPGVSYLFCNIHPEMSAVIVAVESRWFGASDETGKIHIGKIPPGQYVLHVWHENASPEVLKSLQRTIEIQDNRVLSPITLTVQPQSHTHKNKYGKDYDPDVLKPDY